MKPSAILLITLSAFITAATFKSVITYPAASGNNSIVADQKKFSIRCSPLYIPGEGDDIPALEGWGSYRWKITANNDSAQFYFNQGINMYYGFHIIESRASFDKAIRFDPECAMAWWGKALAFGPNINDFGYERPSEAYPSAIKANEFKGSTSPFEKALIEAMTVRYTDDSTRDQGQLNVQYKDAMYNVYEANKQNENASVLYADALMLLHSWDLYNHDYTPKTWTPEIVAVLIHTLALNPKHPGANHLMIHAVEGSANPGQALPSAAFLADAMPGVSHVTHMPSHIYIRTGYYEKGIVANDKAVKAYHHNLPLFAATEENVALYELHNIHMKLNCAQMAGNYQNARSASQELQDQIPSFYLQIPGPLANYVQYLHQSPLFTMVRFGKWQDIMQLTIDDTLSYSPVLQYFARGIAFAKTNQLAQAKTELQKMQAAMQNPSLKVPLAPFNSAYDCAVVGENILAGIIAEQQKDVTGAIGFFKKAVVAEDNLIYNEPRDWLLPARQYLGEALVRSGKYNEAILIFNKDLEINPNNGWSLTGLSYSYKALKKNSMLAATQKRLKDAWVIRDTQIASAVF